MANESSSNESQKISLHNEPFTKSDIISVFVGPDKERYHLHAEILAKSPFFKSCLRSGMAEQIEKTVNLSEDDPKSFGIVADWLYTARLPAEYEPRVFMSAYVLADKLCMGDLQNALMDVLRDNSIKVDPADVCWAWGETGDGSKLRQFMVDALHESVMCRNEYWSSNVDKRDDLSLKLESLMSENGTLGYQLYSKVFNHEVVRESAYQYHPNPFKKGCKYHVHGAGERCSQAD